MCPKSTLSKRGHLTILSAMLTLCQTGPIMKTHLMYRANLSHGTLTTYLAVLLDKELCTEEPRYGTTVYRITARGRCFLHEFRPSGRSSTNREGLLRVIPE